MTASHLQTISTGPVQLIGLPRNINRMGVTNPRILHRRLIINNNNGSLGISSAKRCLFGSPEPGEIQELYEEEMRRNRERFIKRYNFDIFTHRFVNNDTNNEEIINNNNLNNIETDCEESVINKKSTKSNIDDKNIDNYNNKIKLKKNFERKNEALRVRYFDEKPLSITTNIDNNDICDVNCTNNNINNSTDISNNYTCNLLLEKDNTKSLKISETSQSISILSKSEEMHLKTVSSTSSICKEKKSNERLKPYSRQNLLTDYYSPCKAISSKTTAIRMKHLPQSKEKEKITSNVSSTNLKKCYNTKSSSNKHKKNQQ